MQFKVHAAAEQLSRLIDAALDGQEVIITRGDTPLVRLVPIPAKQPFVFDVLANELKDGEPDFLEPMSEDDLALWEGGDERNR